MKAIKILAAVLAAIGALLVGLYLPKLIVRVQSSQQPQSFPVEIVDLENITEDTSVQEMLSLVYNRELVSFYSLSKGRYLATEDVEKICMDMAEQIYEVDIEGVDTNFGAQPNLYPMYDGTSYVLWDCELWIGDCCLIYLVDDTTGNILSFEINDDSNQMFEKMLKGKPQSVTDAVEPDENLTALFDRMAEAFRQNFGYDDVTVTLVSEDLPYEMHYQFEFTDQDTGDLVTVPVALFDQYYLCFNL